MEAAAGPARRGEGEARTRNTGRSLSRKTLDLRRLLPGGAGILRKRRGMSRTSHYAFILAKMYGIIARSYVGRNFRDLLRLKKISELYDLLFPGERGEQPEHATTGELEARIVRAGIDSMTYVLDLLGDPPKSSFTSCESSNTRA